MKTHDSKIERASFVRLSVIGAAFLVAALMVVSASRAPFTASTSNSANSVGAATVTLTDDDSGSAMYSITDMLPGQTEVRCILVSYGGTAADPAPVKLYSGGYTDSGNFADYVNVTIEEGTGAISGDCSGFVLENAIESGGNLAAFDVAHNDYATGAGVWDPATTPETKAYRITLELDSLTPDAEQGEAVSDLVFTWETQS
ncbi:MAG: hypothetical protein ACR2NL_09180 [Acidimicrobiia bacterium]